MTETYATIRDDYGLKSLSNNERDFLRSCADREHILRVDGRRGHELRKMRLQLERWDNGAECTVQWGRGTRVTALCSADLVPPSSDRPNEGMVNFTVDISPMAGSSYRQAPPVGTAPSSSVSRGPNYSDQSQRLLSNRILRSLERIILTGGALDTEALVVAPGKWVWKFTIALTVLDDGGNLLDTSIMAAITALRHYRKPQIDFSESVDGENADDAVQLPTMIPSIVKEATPLPLHHTPLSISFSLVPSERATAGSSSIVTAIVDPTDREELIQSGSLTIAMNVHAEVCLLDFGGGCEISPENLKECFGVAETSVKSLCRMLETALTSADEKAQQERLKKLQNQRTGNFEENLQLPPENAPYFEQSNGLNEMEVDVEVNADNIVEAQTQAEEAYKQQALDYSLGHVATKVREDKPESRPSAQKQAASLLASLLKSATLTQGSTNADTPAPDVVETKAKTEVESSQKGKNDSKKVAMELDDDEEEAPTILQSEFIAVSGSVKSLSENDIRKSEIEPSVDPQDDDMVDLSMAIKSKKKKTKKKK